MFLHRLCYFMVVIVTVPQIGCSVPLKNRLLWSKSHNFNQKVKTNAIRFRKGAAVRNRGVAQVAAHLAVLASL